MKPNVEDLQIANRDLMTLLLQFNAVSELMNRSAIPLDKMRVLESIATGVRSELAFDRVAIWKYDAPTQSFLGEAAMGLPVALVRSLRFPLHACLALVRQALNEGRTLRQDPAVLAPLLEAVYEGLGEPVREAIVVPLLSRAKDSCWRVRRIPEGCAKAEAGPELGTSIVLGDAHVHDSCLPCPVFPVEGFLWADNVPTGRALREDLLPLNMYLHQADLMLENAVLYEQLSRVTIQDAMTGVFNRAYFNHLIRVEIERSLRYEHTATVLLVDIHGLRRINEAAGQSAGDRVLVVLGELLKRRLRRIDIVARYGGDEFAILLPHTDGDHALKVAGRLHRAVAQHRFHVTGFDEPILLSMGLAVVPENAADADTAMALAEFALQEARSQGAGCTIRIGDPKTMEVR